MLKQNFRLISSILMCSLSLAGLTGCKSQSSKVEIPSSAAVQEKCERKQIRIYKPAQSKGVLFTGFARSAMVDPERELLKRRLSFLEVYGYETDRSLTAEQMKQLLFSEGVTRYYFAEINSGECNEFNKEKSDYPNSLIELRRLGLPENLCIAKKKYVRPMSQYFFYSASLGQPNKPESAATHFVLANFDTLDIVAEGYYLDNRALVGCFRIDVKTQLLNHVQSMPDPRIFPAQPVDELAPKPFKDVREVRLKLVESTDLQNASIPKRPYSTITPDASVYFESYSNIFLEIINRGKRRRIQVSENAKNFEGPSSLRVNGNEITFLARPNGNDVRHLNKKFFRYSRNLEPLSVFNLRFIDFAEKPDATYTYDEAMFESGKLSLIVYEQTWDDHRARILNRFKFQEQ